MKQQATIDMIAAISMLGICVTFETMPEIGVVSDENENEPKSDERIDEPPFCAVSAAA